MRFESTTDEHRFSQIFDLWLVDTLESGVMHELLLMKDKLKPGQI